MRTTACAAIIAALLAASPHADAKAWAEVSFAGLDLGGPGAGTSFDSFFFGEPIAGGTRYTAQFPYTITLHADGDAASREWAACLPLATVFDCGPRATGAELVEFEFGTERSRLSSPFTTYELSDAPPALAVEADGTVTYRGTLSITETVADFGSFFPQADRMNVWAATWIDASAVPEPAAGVLLLLGLGMLVGEGKPRRGRPAWAVRAAARSRMRGATAAAVVLGFAG